MNRADIKQALEQAAASNNLFDFESNFLHAMTGNILLGEYQKAAQLIIDYRGTLMKLYELYTAQPQQQAIFDELMRQGEDKALDAQEAPHLESMDFMELVRFIVKLDPATHSEAQVKAAWEKVRNAYFNIALDGVQIPVLHIIFQAGVKYGKKLNDSQL